MHDAGSRRTPPIALAVVAGEHLFLHGPPGTAKSALIRQFATAVRGRYFEYLLTRFSEPNEVFGPIDLVRLREFVASGMLKDRVRAARLGAAVARAGSETSLAIAVTAGLFSATLPGAGTIVGAELGRLLE